LLLLRLLLLLLLLLWLLLLLLLLLKVNMVRLYRRIDGSAGSGYQSGNAAATAVAADAAAAAVASGMRIRSAGSGGVVGTDLFAESSSAVAEPHLNAGLGEFGALGQLLPGVDVGILGPVEGPFQFVHLLRCERRPMAALLLFQRKARLRFAVGTAGFCSPTDAAADATAAAETSRRSTFFEFDVILIATFHKTRDGADRRRIGPVA